MLHLGWGLGEGRGLLQGAFVKSVVHTQGGLGSGGEGARIKICVAFTAYLAIPDVSLANTLLYKY